MKDKTAKDTLYTPEGGNHFIPKTSGEKEYDLLISKGIVYDGSGNPGMEVDVAIKGDMIVQIGKNLKKSNLNSLKLKLDSPNLQFKQNLLIKNKKYKKKTGS